MMPSKNDVTNKRDLFWTTSKFSYIKPNFDFNYFSKTMGKKFFSLLRLNDWHGVFDRQGVDDVNVEDVDDSQKLLKVPQGEFITDNSPILRLSHKILLLHLAKQLKISRWMKKSPIFQTTSISNSTITTAF